MQSHNSLPVSKKVAYTAVLTALAAVAGYIEMLMPVNIFGIPGVKLGLANIVSLVALFILGIPFAYLITVIRVILLGVMFGNMYSVLFGLCGGVLSMSVMILLKRTGLFTMTGLSAAGGAAHNLGQLFVAFVTLNGLKLKYYIPVLILAGTICGCIVGLLASVVTERLGHSGRWGADDRFFEGDT